MRWPDDGRVHDSTVVGIRVEVVRCPSQSDERLGKRAHGSSPRVGDHRHDVLMTFSMCRFPRLVYLPESPPTTSRPRVQLPATASLPEVPIGGTPPQLSPQTTCLLPLGVPTVQQGSRPHRHAQGRKGVHARTLTYARPRSQREVGRTPLLPMANPPVQAWARGTRLDGRTCVRHAAPSRAGPPATVATLSFGASPTPGRQ